MGVGVGKNREGEVVPGWSHQTAVILPFSPYLVTGSGWQSDLDKASEGGGGGGVSQGCSPEHIYPHFRCCLATDCFSSVFALFQHHLALTCAHLSVVAGGGSQTLASLSHQPLPSAHLQSPPRGTVKCFAYLHPQRHLRSRSMDVQVPTSTEHVYINT